MSIMKRDHVSHSQLETFRGCPYRYKLSYVDDLTVLPEFDNADNALLLGTCIHRALETGDVELAINEYMNSYPAIDEEHITEALKMELALEKTIPIVPSGEHEVELKVKEHNITFLGYIDLLHKNIDGTYDIYDFKYSNNIEHYLQSPQLSLYKHFAELSGLKIRKLHFLFIPKITIKQLSIETVQQYRNRIIDAFLTDTNLNPKIVEVMYDEQHIKNYYDTIERINEAEETNSYPKSYNTCFFCGFKKYCESEGDINYMLLPKTERRDISKVVKRKIWIYGAPFSGKTTLLDEAPNPLNLNTDGNINFVTMPVVPIKDEVTTEGRLVNRKFAWAVFKETIEELEKHQNDFKTIIIDLVDDMREYCRIFEYDKLKIQHESDAGFGRGYDMIKTEFLSTMKRFFNLPYENLVIVSHEDTTRDITTKSGQNITKIKPNIQEALANKLAGMVDIVARVVVEEDGSRTLNFKSNEVVFGGGRLRGIKTTKIPLKWSELVKVYDSVAVVSGGQGTKSSIDTQHAVGTSYDKTNNSQPQYAVVGDQPQDTVGTPQYAVLGASPKRESRLD